MVDKRGEKIPQMIPAMYNDLLGIGFVEEEANVMTASWARSLSLSIATRQHQCKFTLTDDQKTLRKFMEGQLRTL